MQITWAGAYNTAMAGRASVARRGASEASTEDRAAVPRAAVPRAAVPRAVAAEEHGSGDDDEAPESVCLTASRTHVLKAEGDERRAKETAQERERAHRRARDDQLRGRAEERKAKIAAALSQLSRRAPAAAGGDAPAAPLQAAEGPRRIVAPPRTKSMAAGEAVDVAPGRTVQLIGGASEECTMARLPARAAATHTTRLERLNRRVAEERLLARTALLYGRTAHLRVDPNRTMAVKGRPPATFVVGGERKGRLLARLTPVRREARPDR